MVINLIFVSLPFVLLTFALSQASVKRTVPTTNVSVRPDTSLTVSCVSILTSVLRNPVVTATVPTLPDLTGEEMGLRTPDSLIFGASYLPILVIVPPLTPGMPPLI